MYQYKSVREELANLEYGIFKCFKKKSQKTSLLCQLVVPSSKLHATMSINQAISDLRQFNNYLGCNKTTN